jgi:hypothetical protein
MKGNSFNNTDRFAAQNGGLTQTLGGEINMNDTDMHIQWQDGSDESVEIGYLNPHDQQCCGHCGVSGTVTTGSMHIRPNVPSVAMCTEQMDPNMYERRCPKCQEGAAGIKYWKIPTS